VFFSALAEARDTHKVTVNGYVLMTNHVHLVVTPETSDSLALAMQAIGRRYVHYFNREYGRTGGLFEGRYRSLIINTELYWYRCMRYVELNPIRAGLAERPEDYRWSSYRSHALGAKDSLVDHHYLYTSLGASPAARQTAWREICRDALPDDQLTELREMVHRGTRVSRRVKSGSDPGYEL
jgi:putative transposase